MKFSIGDKAVPKKNLRAHTNYPVDEVVGFLDGAVLVKVWGDGFGAELHPWSFKEEPGSRGWQSGIVRYLESELLTTEEALVELRRLEEVQSKLEEDFNAVRDLVQEKMEQAAKLVEEADALVKPTGKNFYHLKNECMPLYNALDDGGWSHSTMRC